ncbi:DNA-binding winged helix-turn-helix (wHTH) protein [Bradyrhizobium japonicum]
MRYLFDEYVLDTDRRELHRGADAVSVAPQVFDILDYLIGNRERVVSKDDLMNAIWKGRIVSEAALATRINGVRTAVGDCGEAQRIVERTRSGGLDWRIQDASIALEMQAPMGVSGVQILP